MTKAKGVKTPSKTNKSRNARNLLRLVSTYNPGRTARDFSVEYFQYYDPQNMKVRRTTLRHLIETDLMWALQTKGRLVMEKHLAEMAHPIGI